MQEYQNPRKITRFIGCGSSPTFLSVFHPHGIAFTLVAISYTILGGMSGIVWADLVQYAVMTIAAFIIGGTAMHELAGKTLAVPVGWDHPFFGWRLNLDWTGIIAEVNRKISEDQFSSFSIIMMLMLFKGIFASAAGPAPNYDMQKVLATRSPAAAAKMSGSVSLVLLPIYVVLLRLVPALIALGLAVLTSWILKTNWLDHLEEDDPVAAHEVTTGPAVALGELT